MGGTPSTSPLHIHGPVQSGTQTFRCTRQTTHRPLCAPILLPTRRTRLGKPLPRYREVKENTEEAHLVRYKPVVCFTGWLISDHSQVHHTNLMIDMCTTSVCFICMVALSPLMQQEYLFLLSCQFRHIFIAIPASSWAAP